jgi:hypothetical protein
MHVIFTRIPKFCDSFVILLEKMVSGVYYLQISPDIDKDKRVQKLAEHNILPLPLETHSGINQFFKRNLKLEKQIVKKVEQICPKTLINAYAHLFPNIYQVEKKLNLILYLKVVDHYSSLNGVKLNIWADNNPSTTIILIDFSITSILTTGLPTNVRTLTIPLDIVKYLIDIGTYTLKNALSDLKLPEVSKKPSPLKKAQLIDNEELVVLVTHKGLQYGNLYKKDHYYSNQKESRFHMEKILHFDYSGFQNPLDNIKWVSLGLIKPPQKLIIKAALSALFTGMKSFDKIQEVIGVCILSSIVCSFESFRNKINQYPNLKLALIDYEILCPKVLLMAFEAGGVKTCAVQERFILPFHRLFGGAIISEYLSASPFMADEINKSPVFIVEKNIPIGQYRSDILYSAREKTVPIIRKEREKGRLIITALGFHTHLRWHESQIDPLLNWTAHQHFLEDMIRLSEDIPNVFIILRYKDVNWMSLPRFAEWITKIEGSDKITISTEYNIDSYSYHLCAHSDLVIAKHTSLADECLSVGIPVLFHEYSHNMRGVIGDIGSFYPDIIMCQNYDELLERTQIILGGTPNELTKDYEYLKSVVYGGLGDGKVKERIHKYLENILEND